MNKALILGVLGLLVLAVAVPVLAGQTAILEAKTDRFWMVADDFTEYSLTVYADNTRLNGDPTKGIQWRALVTPELEPYITITRVEGNSGNSPRNDFFAGKQMAFELVMPEFNSGLSARLAHNDQGVSNGQGDVAVYYFTISSQLPRPMRGTFDFNNVMFIRDDGQSGQQPYQIRPDNFYVMPDNFPLLCVSCR